MIWHRSPPKYSRIGIRYLGADGEETDRVISIVQLVDASADIGHSLIRAYCHARNAMREFRSDRIKLFYDPDTGETFKEVTLVVDATMNMWAKQHTPRKLIHFSNLQELLERYQKELEQLGWIVKFEKNEEGECFSCYTKIKKTGVMHKHAALEIYYQKYSYESIIMPNGLIQQVRGELRKRPWGLRSKGGRSVGTWATLDAALPKFYEIAGINIENT